MAYGFGNSKEDSGRGLMATKVAVNGGTYSVKRHKLCISCHLLLRHPPDFRHDQLHPAKPHAGNPLEVTAPALCPSRPPAHCLGSQTPLRSKQ